MLPDSMNGLHTYYRITYELIKSYNLVAYTCLYDLHLSSMQRTRLSSISKIWHSSASLKRMSSAFSETCLCHAMCFVQGAL